MRRLLLCIATFALAAGAQQNQFFNTTGTQAAAQPAGSLSGRVVDSATNEPAREVQVLIFGSGGGAGTRTVSTDASGQFSVDELPPGQYYLQAAHQNYPGPLGLPQTGVFAEVLPAKETKGVTVTLSPPGAVSGRVLDDGGEPLSNCNLMLMHAPLGRSPGQPAGFAQSNDKGAFRMAPVGPDRYILQANCPEDLPVENLLSMVGPEGFDPRESWQTGYFPDNPAAGGGASFGVTAGADVKVEFHMKPVAVTSLTGVITAAPGASWKNQPMLQLAIADSIVGSQQPAAVAMVQPSNSFRFTMVQPGNYRLFGMTQDGAPEQANVAEAAVSVGSAPPPPMTVQFRPSMTISGKVEDPHASSAPASAPLTLNVFSGLRGPKATPFTPAKGSVMLMPAGPNLPLGQKAGQVNAQDGAFQIQGVTPGRWRVRYQSYQGPGWMETIHYGDTPAENQQIEVVEGAPGTLSIVLGGSPPTVKYELKDPPGDAKKYWMIQALPVAREGSGNQAYVGNSTPGHSITANSLAPGRYHFFALEQSNGGGMVNDRLLELLSRQVEPVEITASNDQAIAVKCFSVADVQKMAANYIAGEER